MASKSDKVSTKYFDVSRPGKTDPDTTSRPTIVGHRTIMQDPMVKSSAKVSEESKEEDTAVIVKTSGSKIVPSAEAIAAHDEVEAKKAEDEATVPKEKDTAIDVLAESKDAAPEPEKSTEKDTEPPKPEEVAEAAPVEDNEDNEKPVTPDAAVEAKKQSDKEIQETQAKQEAIEKLVVDKTYYAPVGEKKRKRSKRRMVMWLLLVLILAAALGDVMIDSGTIKTSIKPPVSFFNNN